MGTTYTSARRGHFTFLRIHRLIIAASTMVVINGIAESLPAHALDSFFAADPEPLTKASAGVPVDQLRYLLYFGKCKDAEILLHNTVVKKPNYVYDVWRAVSLYKRDSLEEAAEIFNRSLPLHDVSNWVKFCAGDTYFRLNEPAKAIVVFKTIPLNKYDTKTYATRASCYQMLNQNDAAITDLISASKLAPEHRCLRLASAAQIHHKHGRYKEAVILLDQAFDGTSPVAADLSLRILRGFCLTKLNRPADAIKDFTAVIAHEKTRDMDKNPRVGMALSQAYTARAECYEKTGQTRLAWANKATYEKISKSLCDDLMGK